jgi:hypothetical protein
MKKILFSPVTHFNVLLVGILIMIGVMHNHAHYTMDSDTDAYVRKWCKKNPEKCKRFLTD